LVKIRLTRLGTHKRPFYRIIVADAKARRDGPFIEILGTYDPLVEPSKIEVDVERAKHWIGQGAQPTESLEVLLRNIGIQVSALRKPKAKKQPKAAAPAKK
jgi:small subunit ribosomal protein S16